MRSRTTTTTARKVIEYDGKTVHISQEVHENDRGFIGAITLCGQRLWPFYPLRLRKVDCEACREKYREAKSA